MSKIEWLQGGKTWNPITGCPGPKVSPGCANCYAEKLATTRLRGRCGYDAEDPFGIHQHHGRWLQPLKQRKATRIFVCSMGDLFHKDVFDFHIAQVFAVMAHCPQHTFILLTKRHERLHSYINDSSTRANDERGKAYQHIARLAGRDVDMDGLSWPLPNVVLMVTVCNQAEAEEKIPVLLRTPAAMRGVSVEPMLGAVDFTRLSCTGQEATDVEFIFDALRGRSESSQHVNFNEEKLDWVICGGESGPKARPMHPDWVRSLRAQCRAAGVAFFFKGWGKWLLKDDYACSLLPHTGAARDWERNTAYYTSMSKSRAGRLLDGREWNEMPDMEIRP